MTYESAEYSHFHKETKKFAFLRFHFVYTFPIIVYPCWKFIIKQCYFKLIMNYGSSKYKTDRRSLFFFFFCFTLKSNFLLMTFKSQELGMQSQTSLLPFHISKYFAKTEIVKVLYKRYHSSWFSLRYSDGYWLDA